MIDSVPFMKVFLLVNLLHIFVQFGLASDVTDTTSAPILSGTVDICGDDEISGENGYITSPNFPDEYNINGDCSKSLSPPTGKRVVIDFLVIDVETALLCNYVDYVKVTVGNETYSGTTFCGNHIPFNFTTTDEVTIHFHSDYAESHGNGPQHGFKIYWEMVDDCDANSFRCWDGSCIPSTQRCDGNSDCPNNSDEIECAHVPTSYGECGKNSAPVGFTWDYKIVGGNRAQANSYPWTVPLYKLSSDRNFCVATIISDQWLMTAAYCVEGESANNLYGLLGTNNITNFNSTTVQFDSIHIHPDYDNSTSFSDSDSDYYYYNNAYISLNDIALLRTSVPIVFNDRVNPVCLPTNESSVVDNEVCITVGWGSFYEGDLNYPDLLHQVRLPVVDNSICGLAFPDISDLHLCAGDYKKGGRGTSQRDSGGPLLCYRGGSWFQFGITSFGVGCGNVSSPGVYTNVRSYSSWVEDVQNSFVAITTVVLSTTALPFTTTSTNLPTTTASTTTSSTTVPTITTQATTMPTPASSSEATTADTTTTTILETTTSFAMTTMPMIQSTVESVRSLIYQIGSNIHPLSRLFSFWWESVIDNSRTPGVGTTFEKSKSKAKNFYFVGKIVKKIKEHNLE